MECERGYCGDRARGELLHYYPLYTPTVPSSGRHTQLTTSWRHRYLTQEEVT